MNEGIYGFPNNLTTIPVNFTYPILVDIINCSSGGNSQIVKHSPIGFTAAGSNANVTANLLYLAAHWISRPCLIKNMFCGVVVPTTAGNAHFGLFKPDPTTGLPETCLYSSQSVATVTGYNDFGPACNITIKEPGWYWAGVVFSTNAGPIQHLTTNSICLFPSSSAIANYQGVGLRLSHTFGPMPPSLSGSKFTLVEGVTGFPTIYLNKAPLITRNPIQRG